MSKRKKQLRKTNSKKRRAAPLKTREASGSKPSFAIETLEPRILLSGTWVDTDTGDPLADATSGNDTYTGTAGDDVADGMGGDDLLYGLDGNDTLIGGDGTDSLLGGSGDDILRGGAGDDLLDGGAGTDTADYSDASSGVNVDLTDGAAQNTGGAGTDTLTGIESVVGSSFDDTFSFGSPTDGATYTIDGGAGTNTIDLSGFNVDKATFGDGTMTIDMGGGQSFAVNYGNIDSIQFGDETATVLSGDYTATGFSGSGVFVEGDEAFKVEMTGGGTVDFSYDATNDTLTISDNDGTGTGSTLNITDLNGTDLTVDSITVDTDLGALNSNVDIGTLQIDGEEHIANITVGGGSGTISNLTFSQELEDDTVTVNANIGSLNGTKIEDATLTINGDVGSLNVASGSGKIEDANITINGDLTSLTAKEVRDSSISVTGNVGSLDLSSGSGKFRDSTITIGGDLDSMDIKDYQGTVSVTANGVNGQFEITGDYTYSDNFGSPTQVTFDGSSVSTGAGNATPDAVNDAVTTAEDNAVTTGNVLANDTDPENDSLSITGFTQASNGTVVDNGDGTFTYTPNANFSGNDSFTYTIDDGNGGTSTATVDVTVNAVNDAPTDLLITSGQSNQPLETDGAGTGVTVVGIYAPGSTTNLLDGKPPLTTLSDHQYFDHSSLGHTGYNYMGDHDWFADNGVSISGLQGGQIVFSDGTTGEIDAASNGAGGSEDAYIYYRAYDDTVDATIDENSPAGTVVATLAATDPDANDSFTYSIANNSDFEVVGNELRIKGGAQLNHEASASTTIDVTVTDSAGASYVETIKIHIADVNEAASAISLVPDMDNPVNLTSGTPSGTTVVGIYAPDSGVNLLEGKPALTTLSDHNYFNHGSLGNTGYNYMGDHHWFSDNGVSISGLQGGKVVFSDGTTGVIDAVSNGAGATENAYIYYRAYDANADISVTEGASAGTPVASLSANDPDAGDSVSYSIVGNSDQFEIVGNNIQVKAGATLDYETNTSHDITVRVTDANGLSFDQSFTIQIGDINDAPTASNDSVTTSEDNAVTTGNVLANDSDPDGDALSITGYTQGGNGTVVNNGDGTFTYTPNANFSGSDSFTYTIDDGNGGTSTAAVDVTVNAAAPPPPPPNTAPDAVDDAISTNEDTPITTGNVLANDSDPDGDTLSITGFTQASNGTVVNNGDGTFTYTPNADFSGSDSFTYTIDDGNGGTSTATVIVDVTPSAPAPVTPVGFPHADDFTDGIADGFQEIEGDWAVSDGAFTISGLSGTGENGITVLNLSDPLPDSFDIGVTLDSANVSGQYQNGFVIFDYNGPNDFKFAGARVGADYWTIGHYNGSWVNDVTLSEGINTGTSYDMHVSIENGAVTLSVDGIEKVNHDFGGSLSDGQVGLGADHAQSTFDNLVVDTAVTQGAPVPPEPVAPVGFPHADDFTDGVADGFQGVDGNWAVADGAFTISGLTGAGENGITVLNLSDPLPDSFEIGVTLDSANASGQYQNGFVIFDYNGPNDFKFAGARVGADYWTIGHYNGSWVNDITLSEGINTGTPYDMHVSIENGAVTLSVDGVEKVNHDFGGSLSDGQVGLAVDHAQSTFDNLAVDTAVDQGAPVPPTPVTPVGFPHADDFTDGVADGFQDVEGDWAVSDGAFTISGLTGTGENGITVLNLSDPLPDSFDIGVTLDSANVAGQYQNGFVIFDYSGPNDFKFAGARVGANYWTIGHYNGSWVNDITLSEGINTGTSYDMRVSIENGEVTLSVDGIEKVNHDFGGSLSDGQVGLGADHAQSTFDNLAVDAQGEQEAEPDIPPEAEPTPEPTETPTSGEPMVDTSPPIDPGVPADPGIVSPVNPGMPTPTGPGSPTSSGGTATTDAGRYDSSKVDAEAGTTDADSGVTTGQLDAQSGDAGSDALETGASEPIGAAGATVTEEPASSATSEPSTEPTSSSTGVSSTTTSAAAGAASTGGAEPGTDVDWDGTEDLEILDPAGELDDGVELAHAQGFLRQEPGRAGEQPLGSANSDAQYDVNYEIELPGNSDRESGNIFEAPADAQGLQVSDVFEEISVRVAPSEHVMPVQAATGDTQESVDRSGLWSAREVDEDAHILRHQLGDELVESMTSTRFSADDSTRPLEPVDGETPVTSGVQIGFLARLWGAIRGLGGRTGKDAAEESHHGSAGRR